MTKKFEVICRKCGSPGRITLESSGCDDPECCGGASYWIEIECTNKKCGENENEVEE